MAQFFVFSADDRKKSVIVCTDYLSALGRSYRVLSENGIFNRLWSYRLWDIEGRKIKENCWVGKKIPKHCIFKGEPCYW